MGMTTLRNAPSGEASYGKAQYGKTPLGRVPPDRPTVSTYWRRRFVALVVGLSLLAIVTWALSGAMGGSSPAGNAASTKSVHGSLPSTAAHSTGTHSTGTHSTATHSSAGQQPQGAAESARQHDAPPRPCPAADVVLSVFSSQASYTLRETPEFEVDVVSVASQTCTFDLGARHVWLQISTGPVRVWSSAQCAEGEASMVTSLHRGVPTALPIGWNGQISGPGCPGPSTKAASGTYMAVASDGQGRSGPVYFRLG
jgi:hypothetical protein